MLKNILAITGKPGLYKIVSHATNMIIVESLTDGKRMPAYSRDKIVSLGDISMFTTSDDLPLSEVLTKVGEKEQLKQVDFDPKKADNDQLREWFGGIITDFDRDRVYPSDIRKLILWYNILINAGITDFNAEDNNGNAEDNTKPQEQEDKKEQKKAVKRQVKTQKAAAKATAKTGVGAKKG
jgi:hypothetical protein